MAYTLIITPPLSLSRGMIVNLFKEPSHDSVQESFDWMSSEGPDPSHIDFTLMVWRFKAISFRFGSTGGFG